LQEIEKIANQTEKPTFQNTIVAMEKCGKLLQRANRTFSNLNACNTNPDIQKIDKDLSPKLAAHQDAISFESHVAIQCVLKVRGVP